MLLGSMRAGAEGQLAKLALHCGRLVLRSVADVMSSSERRSAVQPFTFRGALTRRVVLVRSIPQDLPAEC